jgi:hypothetical protein
LLVLLLLLLLEQLLLASKPTNDWLYQSHSSFLPQQVVRSSQDAHS